MVGDDELEALEEDAAVAARERYYTLCACGRHTVGREPGGACPDCGAALVTWRAGRPWPAEARRILRERADG